MSSIGRWSACLLFVGTVILAAGCGGGTTLRKVQGKVTGPDGKGLDDIEVTFIPKKGRGASGTTKADGSYTLVYEGDQREGCEVGPMTVILRDNKSLFAGEPRKVKPEEKPATKPSRIAEKYADTQKTPFKFTPEVEVKAGEGAQTIDFLNLKKSD